MSPEEMQKLFCKYNADEAHEENKKIYIFIKFLSLNLSYKITACAWVMFSPTHRNVVKNFDWVSLRRCKKQAINQNCQNEKEFIIMNIK